MLHQHPIPRAAATASDLKSLIYGQINEEFTHFSTKATLYLEWRKMADIPRSELDNALCHVNTCLESTFATRSTTKKATIQCFELFEKKRSIRREAMKITESLSKEGGIYLMSGPPSTSGILEFNSQYLISEFAQKKSELTARPISGLPNILDYFPPL